MALTPQQQTGLRDACEAIARPINDWLLADVARRIAEAGKMTSTAAYQLYRAKAMGESQRALKKYLKRQLKLSNKEIRRLFRKAARFARDNDYQRLGVTYELGFDADLEQMAAAAIKLAQRDFTNLTQTLGMVDRNGRAQPLRRFYRESMDFAFEQVFTGAADYETAIRTAANKMAAAGVRVIDYESGVHTGLEAATRRNMMGGMGLMVEQITERNHDKLGCNGWEINAHNNSAPDHEPYQGRQYSDEEFLRLNGTEEKPGQLKRRIGTLNCGHAAFPIILGIHSPQYTDEELEEMRCKNAEGVTWQGKHYTGYEATQKQRQIERSIRAQKNRILVAEAAGDAKALQIAQIRLRQLQLQYDAFSKGVGLRTQEERLWVSGFGPGETKRASAAAQKQHKMVQRFTQDMELCGYKVKGFESFAGEQQVLDEMYNAFFEMQLRYPDVAQGRTIVLSRSEPDTFGWFSPKDGSIRFNRTYYEDLGSLAKAYAEGEKTGHFPRGTDWRAGFYHEFGHAFAYFHKKNDGLGNPIKRALKKCGYGPLNRSQIDEALSKELSKYATDEYVAKYREVVAECFAEWYNSTEPRTFCESMLKEVGAI